jgi:hypothetical protein
VKPVLTARDLISLVAFLITAAEFSYWLGRRTRHAINSASDTLAALWAISWGVGEQPHYEALSETIDMVIAALAPAKPAETLSLNSACTIGSVAPATLPLPPAVGAEPLPIPRVGVPPKPGALRVTSRAMGAGSLPVAELIGGDAANGDENFRPPA